MNKKRTFLEKIRSTISRHAMLSGGEAVLVGLSGGPDSICLLHTLQMLGKELDLKLYALYVDHGLRPEETPAEVDFCRNLCEGLSVAFFSRSVDVRAYAKERGLSKQEAARDLRYEVFGEVLCELGGKRIALGHTADDQIETFFMRFFRGSGPKGLSSIPPVRGNIIRPLIEAGRSEIEEFLDEHRISYIVDSSNLKEDYLRNRIRHSFIPEIKKVNPNIAETLSRTTDILREEERYFDLIVTKTLMRLVCRKTDLGIELFLAPMEAMEKVILRRVLRRAIEETRGLRGMEFVHIEEIIELIKKGRHGARLYLPKGLRVIKNYATLILTSETPKRLGTFSLSVPGDAVLEEIKAVIRASVEEGLDDYGDGRSTIVFDADKVGATLSIRSRKEGDFFYPMGFGRRKKLQDFFVDEKVPRDERDSIPIVLSGKEILWVAGYRGDDRFKATGETRRLLRLEFKKAL